MPRYRKKPVEIEAVQLRCTTWHEVCELLGDALTAENPGGAWEITAAEASDTCGEAGPNYLALNVRTTHGEIAVVRHGDWIIPENEQGRFYPCKPDVFAATYDLADKPEEAAAALIEIVEKNATTDDTPGGSVIIPNEVRINGIPLLIPDGHEIRVHDMTFNDGRGDDTVYVTLTLFARRVTIAAEGDLA